MHVLPIGNEVIKLITPKTGKRKAKWQKLPKRGIRITMYRLRIHIGSFWDLNGLIFEKGGLIPEV